MTTNNNPQDGQEQPSIVQNTEQAFAPSPMTQPVEKTEETKDASYEAEKPEIDNIN